MENNIDLLNKKLRLHWMLIAKFLSDTGSWISSVLVLLYTNEIAENKSFAISLVFIFKLLMPLIFTPLLAKLVDKRTNYWWLIFCDILAASLTVLIPYTSNTIVTATTVGTLSTITAIHFSVFNKFLKIYTPHEKIKNSILKQALLEGLSILTGTSIAAIIGVLFSFKIGFCIDAFSFVISATLVLIVFSKYKLKMPHHLNTPISENFAKAFFQINSMAWLILISTFAAILLGVRDSTLIQLIVNELKFEKYIFALSIAFGGIGGILGNLFANKISNKLNHIGLVFVFTFIGALFFFISLLQSSYLILSVVFLIGIVEACYYYFRSNIFFSITPDHFIARGAGIFKIFNASSRSIGIFIFGYFIPKALPSDQFLFLSIFALAASLIAFLLKPKSGV